MPFIFSANFCREAHPMWLYKFRRFFFSKCRENFLAMNSKVDHVFSSVLLEENFCRAITACARVSKEIFQLRNARSNGKAFLRLRKRIKIGLRRYSVSRFKKEWWGICETFQIYIQVVWSRDRKKIRKSLWGQVFF